MILVFNNTILILMNYSLMSRIKGNFSVNILGDCKSAVNQPFLLSENVFQFLETLHIFGKA